MKGIRGQFIVLLAAVVVLFSGVVLVNIRSMREMQRYYKLESRTALALFDWTRLVDQTSGLLLSNEAIGQAYATWKGEYDIFLSAWPDAIEELGALASGDARLESQIAWVRDALGLGVKQLDLVDKYMNALITDLKARAPEALERETVAGLEKSRAMPSILTSTDAFYLNTVRNSVHLLDNMMEPILGTAHARFQGQIAGRVAIIDEQDARLRLIFLVLTLGVLLAFLFRILKLNLDLIRLVRQRTSDLDRVREEQDRTIAERTDELTDANASLNERIAEIRNAEEALRRSNRELWAISMCNQVLVRAEDERRLLEEICRIVCEEAGYRMAWIGYAEDDEGKTIRAVVSAGIEGGYLELADRTWADTERGQGPSGSAIRTGESAYFQDISSDPRAALWRQSALERGYRSSIALPLKDARGSVFGSLCIYSETPDIFVPDEIRLLEELSWDLAYGIAALRAKEEKKQAEEELKASEDRYRRITEGITDYQYDTRVSGGRLETTQGPACEGVTGYTSEEFLADPDLWFRIVAPEDRGPVHERLGRMLEGGEVPPIEYRVVRKDGSLCWVCDTAMLRKSSADGDVSYDGVIKDITERKEAEKKLQDNLQEKEVLLKEVHHRVKNNLNVISSLLNLQSSYIRTPEDAIKAFQYSRDRIMAMAFVHQRLYQSESYARIDIGGYLETLVEQLAGSYCLDPSIVVRTEIDSLALDVGIAVPIGLILNELITNAFKHAFPNGGPGEIRVSFRGEEGGYCQFSVSDNGEGMSGPEDEPEMESLGLTLVRLLVQQIDGTYTLARDGGTVFRIRFPMHSGDA